MSTVSGQSRQSKRLTKRREAQFLLTAAVLTLVILSTFTLFSYRSTVELGLEERRQEASRMARRFRAQRRPLAAARGYGGGHRRDR